MRRDLRRHSPHVGRCFEGDRSHVTRHLSRVTYHASHVTRRNRPSCVVPDHQPKCSRPRFHDATTCCHHRHIRSFTRHTSHVTRHTSHVTRHTSHVTRHTSHVTRYTSTVTRHTLHVNRHTSHVTRHTSHVTRHTSRHANPYDQLCTKRFQHETPNNNLIPADSRFARPATPASTRPVLVSMTACNTRAGTTRSAVMAVPLIISHVISGGIEVHSSLHFHPGFPSIVKTANWSHLCNAGSENSCERPLQLKRFAACYGNIICSGGGHRRAAG
jgi:hypothetical protein